MTAEARGAIMAAVAVLLSHMLRNAVTSKKPRHVDERYAEVRHEMALE